MDFKTYSLIVPLSYLLAPHYKGYQTLSGGLLEDRYITIDGKLFFKPYYIIPLNNNYELEIVFNEDGSAGHLIFEGDLDSCNEIIEYFNIDNPTLTLKGE